MEQVDQTLLLFKSVLEGCLHIVKELYADSFHEQELFDAWLQSNWEFLVERPLCGEDEYLEVYSDGADIYGSSSRVSFIDALPTHKIAVKSKGNIPLIDLISNKLVDGSKLGFEYFCNFDGYYFTMKSPLDHILLKDDNDETVILRIEDVSFRKMPI